MADIGHGSLIRLGDGGGPEVYTTLGEVKSISGPSFSRDAVDTTHMTSANRYRTFIGGLRDGGEITFDINLTPGNATDDLIIDAYNDDDTRGVRVEFPDTSKWQCDALVTGYDVNDPLDDVITASITLKVSGQPSFTAA